MMSSIPDQTRFPRRRIWIACGILALIVLGSASGLYWTIFLRGWTVGKIERLVQAEVPLAITRQEAEAWLDSHGFAHEYFADVTLDRVEGQTPARAAGLSDRDLGGLVRGMVFDANVDLVSKGYINVYLFFDRDGRLVGHLVRPFVPVPSRNRWLN
jgi:hypothetical protein